MSVLALKLMPAEIQRSVLSSLTFREREVVKLRHAFGDDRRYSREDVARIFKTTPEDVLQIEIDAYQRIQELLNEVTEDDVDILPEDHSISFLIDPGTASKDEIAGLLHEMSKLYQLLGGDGIEFRVAECRQPIQCEVGV